eukprot:8689494-Pyramimonas_sp.AAC.1
MWIVSGAGADWRGARRGVLRPSTRFVALRTLLSHLISTREFNSPVESLRHVSFVAFRTLLSHLITP